ncbi:GNAT family N-acetyltransferase [Macrococcus equi]|uniref:GNAT family N-acetyltransferase n=1 Tax=Macrococcus equi TaxID=3395462 RepID=UPI0039BDE766
MIDFHITAMNRNIAEQISTWDFGEGYEFYNINEDPYVIETFLNGHYYVIFKNDIIFGFFCDGDSARMHDEYEICDDMIDIGFALHPNFIGHGYGRQFIKLIMNYYGDSFKFRLTVAAFNQRGIRLYEKMGFIEQKRFFETIEGTTYEFIVMVMNQSQDR